jgi:hypothetical protein
MAFPRAHILSECGRYISTNAGKQCIELRDIRRRDRVESKAEALADTGVPHISLHADLAFLYEKMDEQKVPVVFAKAGLQEETCCAQIAYARDITMRKTFPVDPHIRGDRNARNAPTGGCWRLYEHVTPTKSEIIGGKPFSSGERKTCQLKDSITQAITGSKWKMNKEING